MLTKCLASLAAMLVTIACGSAVEANPSTKDPHAPLEAHGGTIARQLHAEAASLYASALADIKSFEEADQGNRLARMSGKEIGQMRVNLARIVRLGRQLQILGEPSGTDFTFRGNEMIQYEYFTRKWPSLPTSARYMAGIRTTFIRQTPDRQRAVEKLKGMIAEQKWQAAHDELYRLLDALWVGGYLLTPDEQRQYFLVFSEVQGTIDAAMDRIRSETAQNVLTQSRREQTPDFAATLAKMQGAVDGVAATGKGEWDAESLSGPQLVVKIGATWRDVHVATLRCMALDWALLARSFSSNHSATDGPQPTDELAVAYRQFSDAVLKLLADLPTGEAKRVRGDAAAVLYREYLQALSTLMGHVTGERGWEDMQIALNELARQAPGFGDEVAAYDAATTELLRWRARTAEGLAAARSSPDAALSSIMRTATTSRPDYMGLYPAQYQDDASPQLLASAPRILIPAVDKLVGQTGLTRDVVRIPVASRSAIARYGSRVYAIVPVASDLAAEIDALEFDLQVSEDLPPLTLRSAISLTQADRGDFVAVGGNTVTAHLEALITRFATLPPSASVLIPIDAIPIERRTSVISQMLMRFDIDPTWLQHAHFFVPLAAGE